MTELIIGGAFARIAKDFVRLLCFLEAPLSMLIVLVSIGMVFHRMAPIRHFQFGGSRGAGHTQDFVKIALRHLFFFPALNANRSPGHASSAEFHRESPELA